MELQTSIRYGWSEIEEANKDIKTITISRNVKDKNGNWVELKNKYVEVKERVIAFRKVHPYGSIIPEISFTDNYVVCDCAILDADNKVLAKGHSRELANKDFALEKAETSAIGRALGFCGFGISTSIASAEEMNRVDDNQIFDEPLKKDLAEQFTKLYSNIEQVNILNGLQITDPLDMEVSELQKYINLKKYGKKHNSDK